MGFVPVVPKESPGMSIGSLKDLYIDELGDLYDAESQMIRTLPRLAEAARAPELREVLRKHCDESRLHLERLDLIFTHWGERHRSRPCAGLAGIVQEGDARLNEAATADARDAAIIGIAQRIEHYEIAAYGCARTYARRLNRDDEARLLQETLDEEGRTDRRLTEIAEAHILDDARTEADVLEAERATGRLRFVSSNKVAIGRAGERVAVKNDTDDELGTFDGVIVDDRSHCARYAVIDSGGLFVHRRYLVPIESLRFDSAAGILRVNIDKDLAGRYPEFDHDQFETMNDAERRTYEAGIQAHILDLFPRGTAPATLRPASLPHDWLAADEWSPAPGKNVENVENIDNGDSLQLPADDRSAATPINGSRERLVAQEGELEAQWSVKDTATPPHGDKLR
jgi:ferritin-like metal-binding protein YciE